MFRDKCRVEGDRLWSENGDKCRMGGGLTKFLPTGGTPSPREKPWDSNQCAGDKRLCSLGNYGREPAYNSTACGQWSVKSYTGMQFYKKLCKYLSNKKDEESCTNWCNGVITIILIKPSFIGFLNININNQIHGNFDFLLDSSILRVWPKSPTDGRLWLGILLISGIYSF